MPVNSCFKETAEDNTLFFLWQVVNKQALSNRLYQSLISWLDQYRTTRKKAASASNVCVSHIQKMYLHYFNSLLSNLLLSNTDVSENLVGFQRHSYKMMLHILVKAA